MPYPHPYALVGGTGTKQRERAFITSRCSGSVAKRCVAPSMITSSLLGSTLSNSCASATGIVSSSVPWIVRTFDRLLGRQAQKRGQKAGGLCGTEALISCMVKPLVDGAIHPLLPSHAGCLGPQHISSRCSARNTDSAFLIHIHALQTHTFNRRTQNMYYRRVLL